MCPRLHAERYRRGLHQHQIEASESLYQFRPVAFCVKDFLAKMLKKMQTRYSQAKTNRLYCLNEKAQLVVCLGN
jgi:hypothetical protein